MRSIQVYDGSGQTRTEQVHRLAALTHKKPVYVIDRKNDVGHAFLTITVRTANSMHEPLFTMHWQGGGGRDYTDGTMDRWYAGKVGLETKDGEDLAYRTRYLNRLFKLIKTIRCEPTEVVAALETIGIIEGAYDEVLDEYRPLDHHIPVGFARYMETHETHGVGNSSWSALDVLAQDSAEASDLLEVRMRAQPWYADRFSRWVIDGRCVIKGRDAKPAKSAKPLLLYLPEVPVNELVGI